MATTPKPSALVRAKSRSRRFDGDDDVPEPQAMDRQAGGTPSAGASEYTVKPLTPELVEALRRVHNQGFGSKRCCLCCPVADTDGRIARFYAAHPERLPMCGLACDAAGEPLGYVQLAIHPMNDKDDLHTTQPGETYIEQIGVASAARGKGIGKILLQWAEARARERDCTLLTLSVLNGNPARRLYERVGFVAKPDTDGCIGACAVCCLVGRPYGLCDASFGATDMEKRLTTTS